MAYEMVMPYHLHMPSYFLETFTEYPSKDSANKNSFFMMFRIIRSLHVQIEFFSQGYIFFTIHMT